MTLKNLILLAAGAAAIALPVAASAQQFDPQDYGQPSYGQQGDGREEYGQRDYGQRDEGKRDYGQDRGDFYAARRTGYGVYPQFKPIEAQIRQEIRDGLRDDVIQADDARDLMQSLRGIQYQEDAGVPRAPLEPALRRPGAHPRAAQPARSAGRLDPQRALNDRCAASAARL